MRPNKGQTPTLRLFTFQWEGGGTNEIWAKTKKEAIRRANTKFSMLRVAPGTIREIDTLNDYCGRQMFLPLWD